MAENGIRTINLPLDDSNPAVEVIVHAQIGGQQTLRRQSLGIFIARVLALATEGGGASAPAVLATLLAHGFTLDSNGNLHLTEVEAGLAAEIIRAKAVDTGLSTLAAAQGRRIRPAFTRPRRENGGFYVRDGTFEAWAPVFAPARDIPDAASLTTFLQGLGAAPAITRFQLQVYQVAASAVDSSPPGSGALVYPLTDYAAADVLEDPAHPTRVQRATFLTPGLGTLTAGSAYVFVVYAFLANGSPSSFGIAQGEPVAGSSPRDYGWVRVGSNWNGVQNSPIAYEIGESVGAPDSNLDGPLIERVSAVGQQKLHWPGLSALIPELRLDHGRSSVILADPTNAQRVQLVSFGRPGTVTRTMTLPIQAGRLALGHEYVRNVSVVRNSDGAPRTEGTDYVVDYAAGDIFNPNAGSGNVVCRVTYTADQTRYDALWMNPQTGELGNTAGSERGKDVAEYLPSVPPGMVHLYNVYVTAANGIDLVPMYEHRDGVRVGAEGEFLAWNREMRARLPNLLRKMRAGETITICQVGDSIQAQGGQTQAQWTVANGPSRDNPNIYLAGNGVGQDFIDSLPRYDHGDGDGPIHMHIGWIWHLKAAIEACSNSTVIIKNLAVGGSDAGQVAPGCNSPEMLAAYQATGADLFLTNPGMNAIGNPALELQCVSLFRQLRGFGGEVIDMMIPLTPQVGQIADLSDWWDSNNDKVRAAECVNDETGGVAYVPAGLICNPDSLGPLGLARSTLCVAGKKNHPGAREMVAYGRILASIAKGA
ncbi:hypothetical protein [Methylobacterium goesingense]|uniref:Uncharacterized protein n=1 Tax=Methylobacterium goesingense TaxID=243690 RepID=A0ABV2L4P9_9HYPH|nr:hypothetical protein [Methylobacterium goesingense]GJD73336.1 hypothetical protein CFIICLFH_1563 [Methylobacterium goesingense]